MTAYSDYIQRITFLVLVSINGGLSTRKNAKDDTTQYDLFNNVFTNSLEKSRYDSLDGKMGVESQKSEVKLENKTRDEFVPSDLELEPDEQRLIKYLMRDYERAVRPVRNASSTVMVKMGLTMTQIFDMDEKNQVLVTNVWLDQEWGDEFLKWRPEDFGGLEVLRVPCKLLWRPDLVLYNNAAQYTDDQMPANAMVQSTGDVFWPVPTKLQSTCKVDVTYFPFDEQKCKMKFGSWTYDGFQVDITNRTAEVDLSNYVVNGEWQLMDVEVVRNVVYYACCNEPFPDVTFSIKIRRRTLYYMYNVVFPCIMMSALTLLVFCLPPDSGEKIALGITVLLAFSVFMLAVAENLPETSEFVPLMSIYLTIVMAMTSVSVIFTVFVLNLHYRGRGIAGPNHRPVPDWIRSWLLVKRDKPCCQSSCGLFKGLGSRGDYHANSRDQSIYGHNSTSVRLTIENIAQELRNELECENNTESSSCGDAGYQTSACNDMYARRSTTRKNKRTNQDILEALRRLVSKQEKDEHSEYMMQEWRELALVVDRVLFWIFLCLTLASTILILIVAPSHRFL